MISLYVGLTVLLIFWTVRIANKAAEYHPEKYKGQDGFDGMYRSVICIWAIITLGGICILSIKYLP